MTQSITDTKKSRGRPRTTGSGVQIGTRWHDAEITAIDEWSAAQSDRPGRAEAIRRLVRAALSGGSKPKRRK